MVAGVPYKTIVYKDVDGYYMAKSNTGAILAENNDAPELVIQTALDRKGVIWWCEGSYDVKNTFTGLFLKSNTTLFASNETKLNVFNGYTGGALIADPAINGGTIAHFRMEGGLLVNELGVTPARAWDALLLPANGTSSIIRGVCYCKFGPINTNHAKNGICFDMIDDDGWVTSCQFDNFAVNYGVNGIEVRQTVAAPNAGLSTLHFNDFTMQAYSSTQYGLKGIVGANWVLENCAIWDMQNSTGGTGNGVSAQFLPTAQDMLILGGIMMNHNVDNQAAPGEVRWLDRHSASSDFQYVERLYEVNGSETGSNIYVFPHGMGFEPNHVVVTPISEDSLTSPIKWTVNNTNITVTYLGTPPPPATPGNQLNVKLLWRATVK